MDVGLSTVDRFTFYTVEWIAKHDAKIRSGALTLNDYFEQVGRCQLRPSLFISLGVQRCSSARRPCF